MRKCGVRGWVSRGQHVDPPHDTHGSAPLLSSLSRRRSDPELQRREPAGLQATVFSLVFLAAVVTAVALFVLRTSPTTVDTATDVEPAGTTIAAPQDRVIPPTPVPTVAPA